jgi:hypothetical protein
MWFSILIILFCIFKNILKKNNFEFDNENLFYEKRFRWKNTKIENGKNFTWRKK